MSVVVSKLQLWSVSGAPNSKARPSAHARGGLSVSSLRLLLRQLCGRRQRHLPRLARASATQHNDALALGEAHTSRRGHRLLEHTPLVLRGVVHLYGAELMRVVCHIELAAHQKDRAAHRHGAR